MESRPKRQPRRLADPAIKRSTVPSLKQLQQRAPLKPRRTISIGINTDGTMSLHNPSGSTPPGVRRARRAKRKNKMQLRKLRGWR